MSARVLERLALLWVHGRAWSVGKDADLHAYRNTHSSAGETTAPTEIQTPTRCVFGRDLPIGTATEAGETPMWTPVQTSISPQFGRLFAHAKEPPAWI